MEPQSGRNMTAPTLILHGLRMGCGEHIRPWYELNSMLLYHFISQFLNQIINKLQVRWVSILNILHLYLHAPIRYGYS